MKKKCVAPNPQRIKKHSRSRTGCFTCRKRRVKCDEVKPVCGRCDKGLRECTYPIPLKKGKKKKGAPKEEVEEKRPSTSGSESSVNFDLSDIEYDATTVRFSSTSSNGSPASDTSADQFTDLQFHEDMLLDSLDDPCDMEKPLFNSSSPTLTFPTEVSPTSFCEGLPLRTPTSSESTTSSSGMIHIPQALTSVRSHPVQFFLGFHRETITEAHYFRYYDFNKLCTRTLLVMAEQSDALRHAVVAFSALIYSMRIDRTAREQAFLYYAMSIQQLRLLLSEAALDGEASHIAVATALQLSSFDRFFGDAGKCFRHLQGAAYIMQRFSNPVQYCSTPIGRSLLEWYCGVEDYCCFLAAYKALLPAEWRRENVRIRQVLAHEEYPRLPPDEHRPRLLDDLWAQFWALLPALGSVLATLPLLKTLEERERIEVAVLLFGELRQFQRDFVGFLQSPHVLEILQPAPSSPLSFDHNHDHCCPPLAVVPDLFQFPPAGIFQLVLQCIQTYTRAILYPTLRAALGFNHVIMELEDEDAAFFSVELCRTFAGVECQNADNPEVIFQCFSPLIISALTCPPSLRKWLWCKLAHAENLGLRFDGIKGKLSVLWDMPDILTGGFCSPQGNSPHQQGRSFRGIDIGFNMDMGKINVSDESGSGDGSLRSLMQLRGLFGLQNEREF